MFDLSRPIRNGGIRVMAPNHEEVLIDADKGQCALCKDAMQELAAFFTAVKSLYGESAAATAADYWLKEFKSGVVQVERTLPMCRRITIAAASRLGEDKAFAVSRGLRVVDGSAKRLEVDGGLPHVPEHLDSGSDVILAFP
jgi:hypothetical protein